MFALALVIALVFSGGTVAALSGAASPDLRVATPVAGAVGSVTGAGGIELAPPLDLPLPVSPADSTTTTIRGERSTSTTVPTRSAGGRASQPKNTTPDGYGPRPPGSVEVASVAGQSTWTAVSNGVTMTVRIDAEAPAAGDEVRFTLEARDPDDPCCSLFFLFGDGYGFDHGSWGCPGGGPAEPGTVGATTTHVYNVHGRISFMFGAMTGNCQTVDDGSPRAGGYMYGYLDVAPGSSSPQGPSLPEVGVGRGQPPAGRESDRAHLSLVIRAKDIDGYIVRLVVDWGDGTPLVTAPGDHLVCQPSQAGNGWPGGSMFFVPSPFHQPVTHQYTDLENRTVTVRAYSAGCDGTEEQVGSASMTTIDQLHLGNPTPPR